MDANTIVAIVAAVVALGGPVVAYLVAAKQLSGRIKDSDATELWAESRSIRDWSSARIKELSEQIARLEVRLDEGENMNHALAAENLHLKLELEKEQAVTAHLKSTIETMKAGGR
jgi:ABC-type molybdate transport system ATPase subunit